MINTAEQRAFVFAVTFIIIFSVLISTIPVGLLGPDETPDMVTPLNPSAVTSFSETQNYTQSSFSSIGFGIYEFVYDLGSRTWVSVYDDNDGEFLLGAKIFLFGVLWFGQMDSCKFVSDDGTDRGERLTFAEIDADDEDGFVEYTLTYIGTGANAGGFLCYWNTTTYASSEDAYDANALYLLHGMGIEATAGADIASLLISLLLLQIPEVPLLINVLLVVPIWASIIFVLWYIIKEMIPFL